MTAEEILRQLRAIGAVEAKCEFLRAVCRGDEELRIRVQGLLSQSERTELAGHDMTTVQRTPDDMPATRSISHIGAQPRSFEEGRTVGKYKLLQLIGEGGMGAVYMAEQFEPVRRRVAFKAIKPGMGSKEVIARFESERQALSMMSNENIARVLDAGATAEGSPYFVMELVKGLPIIKYCDNCRLPLEARLELFVPVCRAIQHAHQKGIIHRDIKPSNILVAPHDGRPVPKVIDFGLAKALQEQTLTDKTLFTRYGQVVGTLEYMSPEQAEMNALDVDTRSDVYSLGVLLYELITGSTPLQRQRVREESLDQVLKRIRDEEPARPSTRLTQSGAALAAISAQRKIDAKQLTASIRGDLDWVVMKALEKDRARRYQTASDLADDIERLLHDEMVEARPPTTGYRLRKFVRKHRAAVWTTAAFLALLIVASIGSTWLAIRATHAEYLAERRLESSKRSEQQSREERDRARRAERRALEAEQTARTEAAIATAVSDFLQEDLLDQASPSNQPDRDIKLRTILHRAAERINGRFVDQPLVEAAIRRTLGQTLLELGEYEGAEPQLRRSWELRRSQLGEDQPETLAAQQSLALLLKLQGRLSEAEPMYVGVFEARRRLYGPENDATLSTMNGLAMLFQMQGRLDEALTLYEQALATNRRIGGETHPRTVTCMNNLAALYRAQKKYDEARELYEQVVTLRRKTLGEEHPSTLTSVNNLALVYKAVGDYSEAIELYLTTLEIRQRVLGKEHPDTLTTMNNLSSVYRAMDRIPEAEQLYLKTLEARLRVLGEEHPDTMRSMNNLALLYYQQGRLEEASELYARCLALRDRILGPEHPKTMSTVEALATVYGAQSRIAEAAALLRRGLEYDRVTFGDDHPHTQKVLNDLALLLFNAGEYESTIPLLSEMIAARQRADRTAPTSSLQNALARSHQAVGEYANAVHLYEAVAADWRTRPGDDQYVASLARTLARIAHCRNKLGDFADAESAARESVALRSEQEADNWRLFNARSVLGESLAKQRNFEDAESELLAGWEGLDSRNKRIPRTVRKQRLLEAAQRLVDLYDAWGRVEQAEAWRRKLARIAPDETSPGDDGEPD